MRSTLGGAVRATRKLDSPDPSLRCLARPLAADTPQIVALRTHPSLLAGALSIHTHDAYLVVIPVPGARGGPLRALLGLSPVSHRRAHASEAAQHTRKGADANSAPASW